MSAPVARRTAVEAVLRRDRIVVLACLAAVAALAWAWLFAMDGMAAPVRWNVAGFAAMFAMWSVMMVGMMTPSAAPMVLLFATVNRRERDKGAPFVATGVFAAGYLAMWCGFSLAAVVLQWALHQTALLTPMMGSRSTALSGALLIAAGLYQLTLCRMLLGADGAAVRRRRHEPVLGRGDRGLRADREDSAVRHGDRVDDRGAPDRRRRLGRYLVWAMI